MNPAQIAQQVRQQLPAGGLFADQHWRIASRPFPLGESFARELHNLGRVLLQFYRASNLLHRLSREGRQPSFAARWLDQGKPDHLLDLQKDRAFLPDVPRVIRPDVLLTEDGFKITELDSIPGGIGLTAWLNSNYSRQGFTVMGGEHGMFEGFASIFGTTAHAHIVISRESASYRPEMEWLAEQLNQNYAGKESFTAKQFQIHHTQWTGWNRGDSVYRFFELFDLENVENAEALFRDARTGLIRITPPAKPALEEKMLFALLWNRNLHGYWRQELGARFFERLLQHVPQTWLIDPTPLPPHGAIPKLDLADWHQLKGLSQKERDLILKVSGFSETSWGARGVHLGSDLSVPEWSRLVDQALQEFPRSPYILQRYHKPRLVDGYWFDFDQQREVPMRGRVRLCPYYFVTGDGDAARAHLGGVLATICPADKKIIHGMKDAILAPCVETQ